MRFINKISKLLIVTVLSIVFTGQGYAASTATPTNIIELEKGPYYSSDNLYAAAIKLVKEYPDLLQLEVLGKSTDGNPMYVIRFAKNVNQMTNAELQTKNNIMVSGGLHAKEVANPVFILKTIEDYAKDYQNNAHLNTVDVRKTLDTTVYHFMPLCNPDGFDLVKYGVKSINTPSVKAYFLKNVKAKDYSLYKANLRGVDLNRNFENIYYEPQTDSWKDRYNSTNPSQIKYSPSDRFYSGEIGEEIETKIISGYYLKYNFRVYLSYHSQGKIVYSGTRFLDSEFNELASKYQKLAMAVTGYRAVKESAGEVPAWGYESGYVGYNAYKPLVTIETLTKITDPRDAKTYGKEYNNHKLYKLPSAFAELAQNENYSGVKLYKDDVYVLDVKNRQYAEALSKKYQLAMVEYQGAPKYNFYSEAKEVVTFEKMVNTTSAAAVQVSLPITESIRLEFNVLTGLDGSKLIDFYGLPADIQQNFSQTGSLEFIQKSEKTFIRYDDLLKSFGLYGYLKRL